MAPKFPLTPAFIPLRIAIPKLLLWVPACRLLFRVKPFEATLDPGEPVFGSIIQSKLATTAFTNIV